MSAIRLRCRGSRCCTTTSAAGKLPGSAARTSVSALSPPAEAASATISKPSGTARLAERPDQPAQAADAAPAERDGAHGEERAPRLPGGGLQRRFPDALVDVLD